MIFIRTETRCEACRLLKWRDSNGYWGVTKFDDLGRQVEYIDYSGFYRQTKYHDDGSIEQICNNGLTFIYTPKPNGKFICVRVSNEKK
jgi:hypothetical protein